MEHCPYWRQHGFSSLRDAKNFRELGEVALRVLSCFPEYARGGIVQVCGPISTGGFGSREKNLAVFGDAVRLLREEGRQVFDQTPLEDEVVRLWELWKSNPQNTGYCWAILEDIYTPIFQSGMVGTLFFLPGWEGSTGSRWEREHASLHGLDIQDYPTDLYKQILADRGFTHP